MIENMRKNSVKKFREEVLSIKDYGYELTMMWKNVFKSFPEGDLIISPESEETSIGTTLRGSYICCRTTNRCKKLLGGRLLHNSYARSEDDLYKKLKNWGHTKDFDINKYFEFWKNINLDNYKNVKNFHPLSPETWGELIFIPKKENGHD